MKRWTRTALLCAMIAAVCHSSPGCAAISNGNYIAETTAINVINHFPDNMAVGISPETPLTVEFGGALNQSFYQNVSFNLFNGTEPVNGELFYNPAAHQIMFKAAKPLEQGKTYTAQVSFYDGLGRTSEKVWSFQTASLGETSSAQTNISKANTSSNNEQAANVKNLVLTNASMGVGTIRADAPMEVSFSEALDVASLKTAPVQLFENNRPVGIDYRLSKDMKTITVTPRNALKANASYAITIDKTIASTSGKKLAKKTLIPFKLADGKTETAASKFNLEEKSAQIANAANQFSNAANQFSNTASQLQNTYQQGQQNVNQAYNGLMQSANQSYSAMQQNTNQAYNGLMQSANQSYSAMKQNVNQAYNGLVQSSSQNYSEIPQNVNQAYNGLVQSANQNYSALKQNVQSNAQNLMQNSQYTLQNASQNLNNAAQSLQSGIENPFANDSNAALAPNMSNYSINQLQVARAQASLQQQQAPVAEQVQLTALTPQNGSKVSNLAQPITINFSAEIKPETLNEFTFRLEDDFGPVPAKIHYFTGHKQATLTPVGLLDAEKNYRVVVTQGITDVYGRPIKTGINSMFATVTPSAAPAMPSMTSKSAVAKATPQREAQELESFDNANAGVRAQVGMNNGYMQASNQSAAYGQSQNNNYANASNQYMSGADKTVRASAKADALSAFKVASIYPGLNSDNISRKSKIAVHFSEPCDPKTINNINISVFANQTRVDGKVTYDRRNNRAIFEPTRPLEARTEHKVIVSDKILNKSGEKLSQRFSWTFSTSSDTRNQYVPTVAKTAEADSAFYIPLVDSKVKMTAGQAASAQKASATNTSTSSFTYVSSKHWSFKSMKHIANKGILNNYPFTFTDNVTRYEFASAINNALNNLKAMQNSNATKLRVADMIELEQLIIEYRNELKSYGVNTTWFENFLQSQGVNLNQVETKVRQLNS